MVYEVHPSRETRPSHSVSKKRINNIRGITMGVGTSRTYVYKACMYKLHQRP